jgi:hypothetical protein
MIFRETWSWIIDGSPFTNAPKTMAWRPALPGDTAFWQGLMIGVFSPDNVHPIRLGSAVDTVRGYHGRVRLGVGRTYSVQTKRPTYGGRVAGWIQVTALALRTPSSLTSDELFAFGYTDMDQLIEVQQQLGGREWNDPAWCMTFERLSM